MRVVLVGGTAGLEDIVRRMVGGSPEILSFSRGGARVAADLVVVEASKATSRLIGEVRAAFPDAPLIVVSESSPTAARLKVQMTPEDLSRFTYRQVVDRFGRGVVGDYLVALLRRHEGNVTKAALAAGLERESVHRLMRKLRLRADGFRTGD